MSEILASIGGGLAGCCIGITLACSVRIGIYCWNTGENFWSVWRDVFRALR